jgi:hypothetical protein
VPPGNRRIVEGDAIGGLASQGDFAFGQRYGGVF